MGQMMQFDDRDLFDEVGRRLGVPWPIDHFYLPLVRPSDAERISMTPIIDTARLFDLHTIHDFARSFAPHYQFGLLPHDAVRSMGLGVGYGAVECHLYDAIVRSYRPELIVEIGAGVSTYYARGATLDADCRIVCVEPFPAAAFIPWCDANRVELWCEPLQEAIEHLPERLPERTIMFVDSTHVASVTSELHRIFLDVLPRLRAGSLVHFHDIFLPFSCLHADHNCYPQTANWYESTLLGIVLAASRDYETVFPQYWLGWDEHARSIMEAALPIYRDTHAEGSAYWLMKRSEPTAMVR
jgi:Methyltransferase domain